MDQWNHKGIHGAVIVSMEPPGYINGYRTYLTDFKCFIAKMYPGTRNVYVEPLCGSMDTFTIMMNVYTQKLHY